MRGNLADLASIEGMPSEPTLRKMIASDPAFEGIIKHGSNGDAYEIDLPVAARYIRSLAAKKEEEARARRAQLDQLGLDLGLTVAVDQPGATVADRKALLEEEIVAIKLSKLRGELVLKASVEASVGELLVKVQQAGASFGARLAKRGDVSRELMIEIDRLIEADQAALANWMRENGDFGTKADDADALSADAAGPTLDYSAP